MDKGFLLGLYRRMVTIRRFEESVMQLYLRGIIPGLTHAYSGEEASGVGVCATLREDDYIVSTHRGHGHLIAKGGKIDRMLAEVLGKEPGYNRGRGGTMHIADLSLGMLGANGIVGGGLGIAAGAGWSAKQRGTDQVCVCFYGDGAVAQGVVQESMNLASIWKLPVIYACENNLYGQFTPSDKVTGGDRLGARAEAIGLRASEVYGQDVLSVYETMVQVVDRVRGGGGPEFVELKTYRYHGHHAGDTGKGYRSEEEIEEWKSNRDPIRLFAARLTGDRICTAAELESINTEVQKEVDEAIEYAKAAPLPDVSEVSSYVYP